MQLTKSGLPRMPHRLKHELSRLQYAAVYVAAPPEGNPVCITFASDPGKRFTELQGAHWMPVTMPVLYWTAGRPLAQRVEAEAHAILDKAARRVRGSWFSVTVEQARQAIVVAARKIGVPIITHDTMLQRCEAAERRQFEKTKIVGADLTLSLRMSNCSISRENLREDQEEGRTFVRSGHPAALAHYPTELEPLPRCQKRKPRRRGGGARAAVRTRDRPEKDHPFR